MPTLNRQGIDPRGDRAERGRLRALFSRSLATSPLPREGTICALPVPGFGAHRVGRDHAGAVCLVVEAPVAGGPVRPDIRLQNLSVQRRVLCDISRPTGEHESIVGTIISCCAESIDLRGFFLDLFEQALNALGPAPNERDVDWWIDHATRLFADLEATSTREIRGLWGELLVICEAHRPDVLVRRWHEVPEDRHDFIARTFALEVKTCRDSERIHHFSLSQIRPATEMEVVIVSVPVYADPQGVSVVDLLADIEVRIPDRAIREKLRQTAFRIGGAELARGPQRFDRRAAAEGMRFIRASRIPAIEDQLAAEILDVQLAIKCRDIPGEDLADIVEARLGT